MAQADARTPMPIRHVARGRGFVGLAPGLRLGCPMRSRRVDCLRRNALEWRPGHSLDLPQQSGF
jgi:hypothetical protein